MIFQKGRFITFEGIEGAGKSTQIPLIANWLESLGKSVIITREPGGTPLGEKIRALLLNDDMHELTELLLVFAARAQHITTVIQPALNKGQWVLCDRFTEASYAYQGGGRQLGFKKVEILEKWLQGEMQPDITFWFDLPIAIGLERIKKRDHNDRFEQEKYSFFERVMDSYQARAQAFPKRFHRIDAQQSIPEITHVLQNVILPWLR